MSSFCTGLISGKLYGFLIMLSTGFTSLSILLLFLLSIIFFVFMHISNGLTQLVYFPTGILECDSHSLALMDLLLCFNASIFFCKGFPSFGKFWSCCFLSFHWLSVKLRMRCSVSSQTILMLIGTVFVMIWEMFHVKISLSLLPLLLLVNFVSGLSLELMYISLIVSISCSLTHLCGF